MTAKGFSVRVAFFYAALFSGIGVHLPFVPVWLASRGFEEQMIAALLACQIATRVLAGPAVAFLADRLGDRRAPLIALAAGTFAAMTAWALADGVWVIFVVGVAAGVVWSPIFPLMDAFTLAGARRRKADYGRLRLWGSASFIAASFAAGVVVKATGAASVIWLMVAVQASLFVAALALPRDEMRQRRPARTGDRIALGDAGALLREPLFLVLLAAASLTQATHAVYYGFASLHWQAAGLAEDLIGGLWAFGVIAEIVLFAVSARVLRAIGPAGLLLAGALSAVVRWTITAFDPPLWLLIVAQAGHAGTFGATFLGALHFIDRAVPANLRTTAQGIHAAIAAGLVMGAAMAVSGALYGALAAKAFLVMAGTGAVAALFALALVVRWNGGELAVGRR